MDCSRRRCRHDARRRLRSEPELGNVRRRRFIAIEFDLWHVPVHLRLRRDAGQPSRSGAQEVGQAKRKRELTHGPLGRKRFSGQADSAETRNMLQRSVSEAKSQASRQYGRPTNNTSVARNAPTPITLAATKSSFLFDIDGEDGSESDDGFGIDQII